MCLYDANAIDSLDALRRELVPQPSSSNEAHVLPPSPQSHPHEGITYVCTCIRHTSPVLIKTIHTGICKKYFCVVGSNLLCMHTRLINEQEYVT